MASILRVKDENSKIMDIPMLSVEQGLQGEKGDVGESGESAYEIAVRLGLFNGSEAEWIKSLKGDKGDIGEKGENGVSLEHEWDGTYLVITSVKGTSSVDLKGEKGDTGEQGLQGIQGEKGDTGENGYTPIKGEDYFTPEEINEIKTSIEVKNYVTPEMYGAVGDGLVCDTDAFVSALMSGKKVICDSTKTYYFSKPIDIRSLTKGWLDGNNAHFINFHIYININSSFNGQTKENTADRFIIENMVLGNEYSWSKILEGWETPCITSGSPMIIRNIITRSYPYVYAPVGTYIDMVQAEHWTCAINWDLYSECDISLDAVSYLNRNGEYSRFDGSELNTINGDGWKISQCQEFYDHLNSGYKFTGIGNRLPTMMEQCVQCSIEVFDYGHLVAVGCHFEDSIVTLNVSNNTGSNGKITFINTYFYPTHNIIDSDGVVYLNCFFQCVEDRNGHARTLAEITGNKSWYDLKCSLINCMCPTEYVVDNNNLKKHKNSPKRTYNYVSSNALSESINQSTMSLEDRWISTFFSSVGEYVYDLYFLSTSLSDTAMYHKQYTMSLSDSTNKQAYLQVQWLSGGFGIVAIRTDPDGKVYRAEYYIDPTLCENPNSIVTLNYRDCGSLCMFRIEYDEGVQQVAAPWVLLDTKPSFKINENLVEANGALVTTDDSIIDTDDWNRKGLVQVVKNLTSGSASERPTETKVLSYDGCEVDGQAEGTDIFIYETAMEGTEFIIPVGTEIKSVEVSLEKNPETSEPIWIDVSRMSEKDDIPLLISNKYTYLSDSWGYVLAHISLLGGYQSNVLSTALQNYALQLVRITYYTDGGE